MPEVIQQTIKAEHILGAAIMFVHPTNGNRYYGVCEKQGGTNQDFVVYRRAPGQTAFTEVARLDGAGLDADAFITMGGAVINLDGSLEVWASGQPKGQPDTSGTGFDAIGKIVPGVDEPYAMPAAVKAVTVPAHSKLNPPDGYRPYGANQSWALSAEVVDGLPVWFIAQEGWGYSPQNKGFGEYVFKQVGDRKAEYVRYNGDDVMDGRGDLYVEGNGKLYISGNESDDDKLPSRYEVPGYKPFGSVVYINGGAASGSADTSLLEAQIGQLNAQLAALSKKLGTVEATANKANERALNALNQLGNLPAPGISRDEAWQIAADRMYAELGDPQSGVSGRVRVIAQGVAGTASTFGTDQQARDSIAALSQKVDTIGQNANGAVQLLSEKVAAKATRDEAAAIAKQAITDWLAASIAYTDKRLLNLIWDRGVKLARFLKVPGAVTAPINDENNLKV